QLQVQKLQSDSEHTQAQAKSLVQDAHSKAERQVMDGQIAADETARKDAELQFLMQNAADKTYLEGQRIQRERDQDVLRYQQHAEKRDIEQERADTEALKVQTQAMLESRKQSLSTIQQ
ncbi:hypothetical protein, partial [Herbiconiux daphne]